MIDIIQECFHNYSINNFYIVKKKIQRLINKQEINSNDIFLYSCKYGYIEFVRWILKIYKINIHVKNDLAFRLAYNHYNDNIVKILYYMDIEYYNKKFYEEIRGIIVDIKAFIQNDKNYKIIQKDLECAICIDNKKYMIKLECNHIFCRDCVVKLYDCGYCKKIINKYNVSLILNTVKY